MSDKRCPECGGKSAGWPDGGFCLACLAGPSQPVAARIAEAVTTAKAAVYEECAGIAKSAASRCETIEGSNASEYIERAIRERAKENADG